MRCATALTLAVTLTAMPAHAGPFGIDMGEPLSQLGQVVEKEGARFELKSPPIPHSAFKEYYVTATPETGVCKVEAATPSIRLAGKFVEIKEQLDLKYSGRTELPSNRDGPH